MRIKIINFQVKEIHQLLPDLNVFTFTWRWLLQKIDVQYHFDLVIKVNEEYLLRHRPLERNDIIMLPNKVRLMVWSVDRFGLIRAKTYRWIDEDLRQYHPIEMWLAYEKQHGHMSDRL